MNPHTVTGFRLISLVMFLCRSVFADSNAQLTSGQCKISVAPDQHIQFSIAARQVALVADPIAVDVIDRDQKIQHITGRYRSVDSDTDRITAEGSITCPGGSVVNVRDVYSTVADRDLFSLSRTVTVKNSNAKDVGIRTEFEVQDIHATRLSGVEPFVPGIWYCDASHVPPSGLITDPKQHDYLFREDRLTIPMVMFRDRATGLSLSIFHRYPDGATFHGEEIPATIIDDRCKIASLGLRQTEAMSVVFAYPGVEGDQTRLGKPRDRGHRAERFYPLKQGPCQTYSLEVHLSVQPNFDDAMRDAWRVGFDSLSPEVVQLQMNRVYTSSIAVLEQYYAEPKGVPGFPFDVDLPGGAVHAVSYQMGFVGEQIPCACHLITAGLASSKAATVAKGEKIIDFWAANTLSPRGVPRTWFDVDPKPHWRNYPTFTRIATDGMEGMLQGWRRMKLVHRDKPGWLACCRTYGDWLAANQNADGSFCRQYDWDGKPLIASKSASLHPVRFLIDLYHATGDTRYLATAKKAGQLGVNNIGGNANYFGGTADNNDVKDKEAGWIALDSFLSLYEGTGEKSWLTAAELAASYTETWTYCWNVPMPEDDPGITLPKIKTTAGISLIATGHSGADVFLAFAPYAYYRLGIYTGDSHQMAVAKLLMYNTRQLVDVEGSHHYAQPGLLTEAFTLANPRGHGVNVWLPWCTAAVLDPMQQFADTFGTMDLNEVEKIPLEQRKQMLETFGRTHGFPKPN